MGAVTIITGHYGAGKTNLAVNLAVSAAKAGERVSVVDLDIVNPYFRTADFAELFQSLGIELTASVYANSNLDIPAISFDLERIAGEAGTVIIDVGGDDAGAAAVGRYADAFKALPEPAALIYVINQRRLQTETVAETLVILREIEAASHLRVTGIVNNTNLGAETAFDTVAASMPYARETAEAADLPLLFTTAPAAFADKLRMKFPSEVFRITDVFVRKPWD
ncbi:MAG: cobalamin biosynthesis protein CobQ [Oscillospiraceae bacterium]